MARVKIIIPDDSQLVHTATIPVAISHVNYGVHLGYDSLITILHETWIRFLKQRGIIDKINIAEDLGFVIINLNVNYSTEGFYGDVLQIELYIADIQKKTCDFYYRVTKLVNNDEKIVALANTTQLFIDTETRKPRNIPDKFLRVFQQN